MQAIQKVLFILVVSLTSIFNDFCACARMCLFVFLFFFFLFFHLYCFTWDIILHAFFKYIYTFQFVMLIQSRACLVSAGQNKLLQEKWLREVHMLFFFFLRYVGYQVYFHFCFKCEKTPCWLFPFTQHAKKKKRFKKMCIV